MFKSNVFILIVLLASCAKSDKEIDTNVPACIQSILDNSNLSADIKTIRVQETNDELHYWINTDARHLDGLEFVFNTNCDTICSLGGFIPIECTEEYDGNWMIIWEK